MDGNSYEDDTTFAQPPGYHHYDVVQTMQVASPPPPHPPPSTYSASGRHDSVRSDTTIHSIKETAAIFMEDEV